MDNRDKSIILASATAAFSKLGNVALQLLAVPVVVRSLGSERYALFSLAGSVLAFLSLAQFGAGALITTKTVESLAEGRTAESARVFWVIVLGTLITGGVVAIIGFTIGRSLGLEWLWGEAYIKHDVLLTQTFELALIVGCWLLSLNLVNAAQAGYLELHISNIYGGVGNMLAAASVILVSLAGSPSEVAFLLAIYAPMIVAQLANGFHFLARHREMWPKKTYFRMRYLPAIVRAGAGFMVIQTILPLAQREVTRVGLLRSSNLHEVAIFGAFLQAATFAGGVLLMFTQPIFPAISDAVKRGDADWLRARICSLWLGVLALATSIELGGVLGGPWLFRAWLGPTVVPDQMTFASFGVYFGMAAFAHVNTVILLAAGHLRILLICAAFEICCITVFMLWAGFENARSLMMSLGIIQAGTSVFLSTYYIISVGKRYPRSGVVCPRY